MKAEHQLTIVLSSDDVRGLVAALRMLPTEWKPSTQHAVGINYAMNWEQTNSRGKEVVARLFQELSL